MASNSNSTSQAITKRAFDSSVMPPPPPPKRIKRPAKVIDEDSYTDALSHIIARDFYPGLIEIESKQEYLDAIESQDHEWIAAAGRKLTEVMTPGPDGRRYRGRRGTGLTPASGLYGRGGEDTPLAWQGETPMSVMSSASNETTKSSAKPEVDTSMSLSAFQARYTSEDNESFYKLLDKQNLKKKEKYAWMWSGNKILAPRQIAHRQRESCLFLAKEGKQLLSIEPPDMRPAMPDAWPSNPENSLMFEPSSSLEDLSTETIQQAAENSSRVPPKAIVYDNTRLPSVSTTSSIHSGKSPPPSPTLSAVQAALSGHPRGSSTLSANGPSTPRVAGYAFVDSAPTPSRSDHSTRSSSWDSASLLGRGDATPNPFSIRETGRREALHFRMVDKVAKSKRSSISKKDGPVRSGATPKTAVPKFASSPRVGLGGLTPAGRKLAGKLGAGAAADGKRSGLREFWTPRG